MNMIFKDVTLLVDMIIEEKKKEKQERESEATRVSLENQNKSIISRLVRENSIIRSKYGG